MINPIYATLAYATIVANDKTRETNRYWTAIYDSYVKGWKITDRYHPA
jgi:hypothetical protein